MKHGLSVLIAVMTVGASLSAVTIEKEGKLIVQKNYNTAGNGVNYLCVLKAGGTEYEVKVNHDMPKKTMAVEIEYPLTMVKNHDLYKFEGPYTYSEVHEGNQPIREFYALRASIPGGYDFVLAFTQGSATPEFRMNAGAIAYRCR